MRWGWRAKGGVERTFHVADAAIAFRDFEVGRVGDGEGYRFAVAGALVEDFLLFFIFFCHCWVPG